MIRGAAVARAPGDRSCRFGQDLGSVGAGSSGSRMNAGGQMGRYGHDSGSTGTGRAGIRTVHYTQDMRSAGARPAGNRIGHCGQDIRTAGARPAGSRAGRCDQDLGSADAGPARSQSLYETLGVAPDATAHEIRSAYRQLALRYHPDKNPGDDGQMFVAVVQAFEVLSDGARRARYDQSGVEDLDQLDLVSAEELMEAFFAQSKKTPDSISILSITPQEAQRGATRMARIKRMVVDERGCQRQEEQEVPVTVPAGCQNKCRITLQGLSSEEPGKVPGDYIFVIKVSAAFEQPGKGSVPRDPVLQPGDPFNHGNSLSKNMAVHQRIEQRGLADSEGAQASVYRMGPLNRGNVLPRNMARRQSSAEQHGPVGGFAGAEAPVQNTRPLNHAGRYAIDASTPYAVLDGPTNHGSTYTPLQSVCDEAAWNSAF